ncbi:hypothetical protein IKH83_01285 [Candidatus Saccharibacteria bacterium]|nr:hypothetical protein [Candidatus Saccharibacteria bacterium]
MPEETTKKAPEQAAPAEAPAAPAEAPAAAAPAPTKSKKGKIIAIVCAIVVVLGGVGAAIALLLLNNSDKLVCSTNYGEITLAFNDNDIVGLSVAGVDFDMNLDTLKSYQKMSGLSPRDYVKTIGKTLETSLGTTCKINGEALTPESNNQNNNPYDYKNLFNFDNEEEEEEDDDDYDYSSLFPSNDNSNKQSSSLGSCGSAEECINSLSIDDDMTVEQYNKAIGFDGVLDDGYQSEYTKTYVWKFSNGDELTAEFSSYGGVEIEVEYNRSAHAGNGDIDGYSSIEDRVKGGVSYDELKAALGGKDGLLSAKSDYSTKRIWIGSDSRRYIEARISNSTNQVTSVFGQK